MVVIVAGRDALVADLEGTAWNRVPGVELLLKLGVDGLAGQEGLLPQGGDYLHVSKRVGLAVFEQGAGEEIDDLGQDGGLVIPSDEEKVLGVLVINDDVLAILDAVRVLDDEAVLLALDDVELGRRVFLSA